MDGIVSALKSGYPIRVSNGDRWLVWDGSEWSVYYQPRYARKATVSIRTKDEKKAVDVLCDCDLEDLNA